MEHNKQPAEKQVLEDNGLLVVHSVWETMQGEGPHAGRPAVFVRLAGCNLQCPLCDTDYTSTRKRMSPQMVRLEVNKFRPNQLVVITGGEPFRQNIKPMVDELLKDNPRRIVQVETNGTLPPNQGMITGIDEDDRVGDYRDWWSPRCQVVCSPKTPLINDELEPFVDAYKYVVRSGEIDESDGLPSRGALGYARRVARPNHKLNRHGEVYLQPCDEKDEHLNQANREVAAEVCMTYGYRLTLQLHKLVGME